MKILLLECESPASLQFLKLYNNNKEIKVICGTSSRLPIILFSKFKKKIYFYPKTNYPFLFLRKRIKNFNRRIKEIIKEETISYIISQSESTLIPLLLEPSLKKYLLSPPLSVINILHDKEKLFDYLINLRPKSFKIPRVYKKRESMRFPLIIKLRKGVGGRFTKIIKNKKELLKGIRTIHLKKIIFQQYIPSNLKLVFNLFVSKDGEIKRVLSFRKISLMRFKTLLEELENFFKEIEYFGFASPQFLVYKNQLFLLEINPRLSYYYYGIDFGVGLYEAFHKNIIEDEDVDKKVKILTFPPSFTTASRIYLEETKDALPILMSYSLVTFYSFEKLLNQKYS
jgi:carbamoylphosphate synthase large subunit